MIFTCGISSLCVSHIKFGNRETMIRKIYLLLILIFGFPYLLFSQNLGISISKINTNNYELENPFGFSISLSNKLIRNNYIKLEYIFNQNTRNFKGYIGNKFFINPFEQPIDEEIESKSYIHNLEFSFYYPFIKINENRFGIGAGLNTSIIDGLRKGYDSNKKQNLLDTDKFGYFVYLYSDIYTIKGFPIHLNIVAKYKYLFSSGFATDIENTFNNKINIFELQFGIVYNLKYLRKNT